MTPEHGHNIHTRSTLTLSAKGPAVHFVTLPDASSAIAPAFGDASAARGWLKTQPQTQPLALLEAICTQIDAVDASQSSAATAVALLDVLRQGALVAAEALEPRFLRKPLPLPAEDLRCFIAVQRLWTRQAIAYLRRLPQLPPGQRLLPLHRAASALRLAQLAYYQSAQDAPSLLDHLLLAVLGHADDAACLRQPLSDPGFPHLGEDSIAGHLTWAFMLRICDPYRLSAAQLTVANRALSRWRELASFQSTPDASPRARNIDLNELFLGEFPQGLPRWLELRKVLRKIEQRLASLSTGESPEDLKLGRELSGAAASRLLRQLAHDFSCPPALPSTEISEVELAFGSDHAYALFAAALINPAKRLEGASASLAHQRVAMFGFDRASTLPTAVKRLEVPGEIWALVDGAAIKAQPDPTARRLTPCLISTRVDEVASLGVMEGLREAADGSLSASLRWFDEHVEAVRLLRPGKAVEPIAAFVLGDGAEMSDDCTLLVPTNAGLRLEQTVQIDGNAHGRLILTAVTERGSDFVRYAFRLA